MTTIFTRAVTVDWVSGNRSWTDYLKFSGNYYHPALTGRLEDFDFYEERPARGWDIRMWKLAAVLSAAA